MQADPRGATMALLRVLTSSSKAAARYFHFQWLTEAQHDGGGFSDGAAQWR